ncbi:anaphase-promoting complex subunit cdc27 [Lithohypha guttulata]|uniref:Anaphase-promoting complex subunit cdc27 n=1 Tax=Lithohypha guttulata TaxID=1690604 RepID=A0AAN7SYM9_9EURO|nr:anaphase-promoting complex subunit cdc27 [Lithohypha guttulata]
MAPSTTVNTTQLRHQIYYQLDNNLLKNALFLAQRLVAYEGPRSAEAAYLLAHCQFQAGYTKASLDTSRSFAAKGTHLGCTHVFAQACLELGRNIEGLQLIEKSRTLWQNRNTWNQHTESKRQYLPDAAVILCLKGKLWKAHKNMEEAVQCWVAALKQNPFMWDAYTLLVESGAKINVPAIYKLNPDMVGMIQAQHASKENTDPPNASQQPTQSMADPFLSTQKLNGHPNALYEKLNNSKINVNTANAIHDDDLLPTPSTVVDHEDTMTQQPNGSSKFESLSAPLRRPRNTVDSQSEQQSRLKATSSRLKTRLKPSVDEPDHEPPPPGPPSKRTVSGAVAQSQIAEPIRRTTRSQTSRPPSSTSTSTTTKMSSIANSLGLRQEREIKKAKAPTAKPRTATTQTVGRAVSGNRIKTAPSVEPQDLDSRENRPPSIPPVPAMMEPVRKDDDRVDKEIDGLRALLDLFSRIASAHNALQHYDCQAAINLFNSLPSNQRETPYVLAQIARAYNEMSQHADAERYFIRVRQLAPSRLEDMEIYSTVLYQLKSEIELAYLAHEMVEVERNSPQTWIAIGNSFSLQREHEQALKCFKRATQLDPSFAYGFTLQGHEYIENEEFPKALEAYRMAISADNRHYNAWYGLGKVYTKLGKYPTAQVHYQTAASINPSNAVLTCAIGTVVEKNKGVEHALKFYDRACRLAPKNALSRFKKARCLMSMNQPEEALAELEVLKEIAPDEANVWFLSGRLCKMLGRKSEAIKAFTVALNLDPKAAQFIKDAMESLDDEDDFVDDDGNEDID